MNRVKFLLLLFCSLSTVLCAHDTFFVVVIPSYNNINWYKRNLDSLFAQDNHYSNWCAIYINDCSCDGTGLAVEQYVQEHNFGHKVMIMNNEQNHGALANLYSAIHQCPDDAVIITLDGDDWFYDEYVLKYLNEVYQDPNVWMTYGQYEEYPTRHCGICQPMPTWVIEQNAFRNHTWVSSHVRTFYAWLFKSIKKEDLQFEGRFFPMTWDLAIMFPMLEMAATHMRYIERKLYVYNIDNPINDFKKDLNLVMKIHHHIRKKEKYQPLKERI